MAILVNLTNEECQLLVDVLEAQQKELQSRSAELQTPGEARDEAHRLEVLKRLLWDAQMSCGAPSPDDAELRELGSYA